LPYLHCPRCHRTAWVRAHQEADVPCRHCGTALAPMSGSDVRLLTVAVRERFARDARLNAGRPRFIRDPQQLPD
jgi:ribosomal protein S27E